MRSPYALSALISNPRGIPIAAFEDINGGILRNNDPDTDSLGFYLSSPKSRKTVTSCVETAARNGEEQMQTTEGRGNADVEQPLDSLSQKEPSDSPQHSQMATTPVKEVLFISTFGLF